MSVIESILIKGLISIKEIRKFVFSRWAIPLTSMEQEGLQRALRLMLKWRKIFAVLLVSCLAAAIFEGGTMGILGLAVSVLVEEQELPMGQITGFLGRQLDGFLTSTSRGGYFSLPCGCGSYCPNIEERSSLC